MKTFSTSVLLFFAEPLFAQASNSTDLWQWSGLVVTALIVGLLIGQHLGTARRIARVNQAADFLPLTESDQYPIIQVDLSLQVKHWNQSAEELFGYRAAEALNQDLGELLAPSRTRNWASLGLQRLLQGHSGVVRSVVETRCKDGSLIQCEWFNMVLREANGRSYGVMCMAQDVSAKEKAEKALLASEEKYAKSFMASPDAIIISRAKGFTVLDINTAFSHQFGYSVEEVVGLPVTQFSRALWTVPKDMLKASEHIRKYGCYFNLHTQLQTKHGKFLEMQCSANTVDIQGEVCVVTVARDISKQMKIQAELVKREKHFSTLANASPVGILQTDMQGNILFVNDYFNKLINLAKEELQGSDWLKLVADNHAARVAESWQQLLLHGEEFAEEFRFEVSKGRPLWLSVLGLRYRSDETSEPYVFAVFNDISEAKVLQKNLQLFSTAIEQSPSGFLMREKQGGRIEYVNEAFCRVVNISRSQLLTADGTNSLFSVEEFTGANYAEIEKAIRKEGRWCSEIDYADVDGMRKSGLVNISPVYDEDNNLTHYLTVTDDISELKQNQQRLQKMAFFDSLTGLENLQFFRVRLQQCIIASAKEKTMAAVLYLDITKFKHINESYGHEVGDDVLKEIAQRLQQTVRSHDVVARIGGASFGVILNTLKNDQGAGRAAAKIVHALSQKMDTLPEEVRLGCCIGIAILPTDATEVVELARFAEMAMYQAKKLGSNQYQYYTEKLNVHAAERRFVESQMRRALGSDEFQLFYQPKINLQNGKIVGSEALARWIHPQEGIISPTRFIPVAEETGMIVALGDAFLKQAASYGQQLHAKHGLVHKISVNLSVRQLQIPELPQQLATLLNNTRLRPSEFELELTESMLMHDVDAQLKRLLAIKSLGVGLSLDDFGTGYSSFAYIKRLPIDVIKIDRSFIMDLTPNSDDFELVGAIIAMAHKLSLTVVAEGVETVMQLQLLQQLECDLAQGYLFSPAVPAQQLTEILLTQDAGKLPYADIFNQLV